MRLPSAFLLLVSFFDLLFLSTCNAHPKILCLEKEKQALLDFKLSFVADPMDYLSTWSIDNDDCCGWDGVECDSHTGHVTSLEFVGDLLESYRLRPSLLEFQHLTSLSLNGNQLSMRIPKFIGSLSKLAYLDLSYAGFFGEIPPHLGNLSGLQSLVLSSDQLLYPISLKSDNLKWLSKLSFVTDLDLSNVDLSNAIDWASTLKMLPSLSTFACCSCSLPPPLLSSISHVNSTSLQSLDLSNNSLSSLTFSYLVNGTNNLQSLSLDFMKLDDYNVHEFLGALVMGKSRYSLEELELHGNNLTKLPFEVAMFPSLGSLGLSSNQLSELCPQDLSTLSSLTSLTLSFNRISGSLVEILQHLSANLTRLDLSSNILNGTLSDSHFSKFFMLSYLDLSDNNLLKFKFSKSWVPPFQLDTFNLRSCKVGPSFPNWILTQKNLEYLDTSNSMISGAIPDAFWDFSTRLTSLNLSHNNITCIIPNSNFSFSSDNFDYLDLSYNSFHGPVPLFLFTAPMLYLSNNRFSSFPNSHHGVLSSVNLIYLSNNHLSGSLPNWLFQFDELFVLNLENNNLSGTLPEAIGSLWRLSALHLNNNKFSGQIPLSMKNCTHLIILELGNNNFSGVLPFWLGESMTQLVVLNLRSNTLYGNLPYSLCYLQSLLILDLSDNKITGAIPSCVYNLSRMATDTGLNLSYMNPPQLKYFYTSGYMAMIDDASITWKGELVTLESQSLNQRNVINLSSNCLVGQIPIGMAALKGLRSLDLSRNGLNGSIPDAIGQLTSLEVLKLSSNRLCGEIPTSLASLSFLGTLNLSNNNLSGRIPMSTQLQSFDPSSYAENPKLCGQPLPTKCPGDETDKQPPFGKITSDEDDGSFDIQTFLAASGAGFAFGVFGVLGMLHFNHQWRLTLFQSADCILIRYLW